MTASTTPSPGAAAGTPARPPHGLGAVELSVVMPCLNESDTLAVCIEKAQRALRESGVAGEVIVADNGSTDGSVEIAERLGARVVHVPAKGYGSALMGGIAAARGRYVLMGDADDSYDFGDLPHFVSRLRAGAELVQGCRLPSGGGRVMPGAMPFLHRWWGNPMFSTLVRRWFKAPIHDVNCGLRAFTKELYERLDQRCTGMEFATEMVIKASLYGARIDEIPTTLYPDGRKSHPPHLRTFRDGWRTLRFYLLCSPRWLFLVPGLVLVTLGLAGYALAMPRLTIRGVGFDVHTLLFASLAILVGFQAVVFAVLTKTFAISEGLLPPDPRISRLDEVITLERALLTSGVAVLLGLALLVQAVLGWRAVGYGALDYAETMRVVIPGVTLSALGVQGMLAGFFNSVLGLRRR